MINNQTGSSLGGIDSNIQVNEAHLLDEQQLTKYMKNFVTVQGYKIIDQGKVLLKRIAEQQNQEVVKKAIKILCYFFKHSKYEGKVCTLQFLKQVMDIGKSVIFLVLERYMPKLFIEAIEYRNNVKSILRGSTFFMKQVDKNQKQQTYAQLIRISNTYCRMCHEILYVWGNKYFPQSKFKQLYQKLSTYCTFPKYPKQFVFYKQTKVQYFSKSVLFKKINDQVKMIERQQQATKKQTKKESLKQRSELSIDKSNTNKILKKSDDSSQKIEKVKQSEQNEVSVKDKTKDDEQFFNAQTQPVSLVVKKGSKIVSKPLKQKIPNSTIYRVSAVEDPVDALAQIDRVQTIKTKLSHLSLPMAVIEQRSHQEGASVSQLKSVQIIKQYNQNQKDENIQAIILSKKTNQRQDQNDMERVAFQSLTQISFEKNEVQSKAQQQNVQIRINPLNKTQQSINLQNKVQKSQAIKDYAKKQEILDIRLLSKDVNLSETLQRTKFQVNNQLKQSKNNQLRISNENNICNSSQVNKQSIKFHRKRSLKKKKSIFQLDEIQNIRSQQKQVTKIHINRLNFFKSFDINQSVKQQKKQNSHPRKLQRFREVAMTLVPETSTKQQNKKEDLATLVSYLSEQMRLIANQQFQKQQTNISSLRSLIEASLNNQVQNNQLKNSNKKPEFFSQNSIELSLNSVIKTEKKSSISNSTKRSSLSEIKKPKQFSDGTMLSEMFKRKSLMI